MSNFINVIKLKNNPQRLINITDNNNKEIVSFAYSMTDGGSYVEKIFYELETPKAVMFGRNIDDKVLFIPKSAIKGGWKKDKNKAQNIKIKFGIKLYWKPRKT
ncbi:MAG: hypothetical protein E3J90_08980 [Promethearchaeota archaeon]|nr:MAG: hypothetical protein E3J90_08980 [Candidatus Lokiarchaeota archaeon]